MKNIKVILGLMTTFVGFSSFTYSPSEPVPQKSGGAQKVQIKGTLADDSFDGDSVFLIRSGADGLDTIAKAPVRGKTFAFAQKFSADPVGVYQLRIGRKLRAQAILEAGKLNVELSKGVTSGTKLNEEFAKFNSEMKHFSDSLRTLIKSAKEDERAKIVEAYQKGNLQRLETALRANKDNAIGTFALFKLISGELYVTQAQVDEWRNLVSEKVRTNPTIQRQLTLIDALKATQPGAQYVDVLGTGSHEGRKLSDYVGKPGYVLVDFWASWCGPCRRAMPDLKKIYNEYKDQGLTIVGIAVWDKWEDHLKAVESLELPWAQIFNQNATDAYGILGIPQILLINPQGKIVARDLHGYENIAKILESEKAQNGGSLRAK